MATHFDNIQTDIETLLNFSKKFNTPPSLIETAYRMRELEYRINDAKMHANDTFGKTIDDATAEELALIFIGNYDCNITENDQWDNILSQYFTQQRSLS